MEKRLPRHTVAKKYCVHYLPSTEEKSFCVLYPYRLLEITFKITSAQLSLKHRPMFKASSISDSQYFQYFHLYQSPFSPRFTFYSAPSLLSPFAHIQQILEKGTSESWLGRYSIRRITTDSGPFDKCD